MQHKVGNRIAFGRRPRRDGKHPQHGISQPWWRGRLCGFSEYSGQRPWWQLTPLASPAGVAVSDVAAYPLVQQYGRPPVPVGQHPVKIRAVLAPPAGYQQRPEGPPQPGTGARDRLIGTSRRHPERVTEVKAD